MAEPREQLDELADVDRRLATHQRREIADRLEELTGTQPDVDTDD